MSTPAGHERRKYPRYETDLQIQFYVNFDLRTRVDFQLRKEEGLSAEKYSAVSRNINVEGLCFSSPKQLKKGDQLTLEIYVPSAPKPIHMEGHVRWCQGSSKPKEFDAGVKLMSVEGEDVEKTVFLDPVHHVLWSNVLESVFSSFKQLSLQLKKRGLGAA